VILEFPILVIELFFSSIWLFWIILKWLCLFYRRYTGGYRS